MQHIMPKPPFTRAVFLLITNQDEIPKKVRRMKLTKMDKSSNDYGVIEERLYDKQEDNIQTRFL
jgi:hypothetical protein